MTTLATLPSVETPQLILREIETRDAPSFARFMTQPAYQRHIALRLRNRTEVDAFVRRALSKRGDGGRCSFHLAAEEKMSGEAIGDGFILLQRPGIAEIGWGVHPAMWAMGLGTEIGKALLGLVLRAPGCGARAGARSWPAMPPHCASPAASDLQHLKSHPDYPAGAGRVRAGRDFPAHRPAIFRRALLISRRPPWPRHRQFAISAGRRRTSGLPRTDGKNMRSPIFAGPRARLIAFICNHCPYVKSVIDRLVRDAKDLQALGIGVAAICANDAVEYPEDSFANMKKFAAKHGFTFPYLHDETHKPSPAPMTPSARRISSASTPRTNCSIAADWMNRARKPLPERAAISMRRCCSVAKTGKGPRRADRVHGLLDQMEGRLNGRAASRSPRRFIALGAAEFPEALLDLVDAAADSDASMILHYWPDRAPAVLADRLDPEERPYLYGDYLAGVYRLSPFYRASCRLEGSAAGAA